MRLRQLVLACGLSSLVLSQYASALGLGEVKLKSTLNQPLQAEVKLLDTRDLNAAQILVALASPADFERNGVDRLYFYTEFQFEVVLDAPDGPKVIITTRNPVREPYLNFLIEARWTAGRLLREYTLLMDLPTFDDNLAGQPVQAAATERPAQQSRAITRSTPAPASDTSTIDAPVKTDASKRASTVAAKPDLSGEEYRVRGNDTLWEIALRARPDSSASVHQTMMALYRANPDAFIKGNINLLRSGQVLRLPSADEVTAISKDQAVSQFAQQTGDSSLGAQLNASRRAAAPKAESTEVSGRVKLAAPSSGTGRNGQGSGANDGNGKALESELATTLEELDKSKSENTELSARVKDLEAQIQTMERLVAVSNEKMRSLQVTANQANVAAPASAADVAPTPSSTAALSSSAEVAAVTPIENSSAAAVAPPPAPAKPTPAKPAPQAKKVLPPPPPSEPTITDLAIENAPWIGLGLLGLAGVVYLVYRRRKQNEEEESEFSKDVFAEDNVFDAPPEDTTQPYMQNVAEEFPLFEEEETSAIAETGDVVGEADIYIAYGKLDQAEEMLLNGLEKDPNSVDIRMKLLEVYAQQQNATAFDKHYVALLPLAGGVVLARAAELRDSISDAGEFQPNELAENASYPVQEDPDDFAVDDFQLDDDELDFASNDKTQSRDDELSFDLDNDFAALELDSDSTLVKPGSYNSSPDFAALENSDDDFVLDLNDDEPKTLDEADDLHELSLALDELDADTLPADIETKASTIEDEFSFDLDDDEPTNTAIVAEPESPIDESLDVPADDFNLDMDVNDVDLAALDHEMESLDVDFDDDLTADDITNNGLVLTDDLDKLVAQNTAIDFAEDDIEELKINGISLGDEDEFTLEPNSNSSNDLVDLNRFNELSEEDFSAFPQNQELLDNSGLDNELDSESVASRNDDAVIDIELDDEIPATPEAPVDLPSVTEFDKDEDEDLFAQALSDFSNDDTDLNLDDYQSDASQLADLSDEDMDAELDFLADADEAATKLDLARAYIDMGDAEGAKDILAEVTHEGNEQQRQEAIELLGRIDV